MLKIFYHCLFLSILLLGGMSFEALAQQQSIPSFWFSTERAAPGDTVWISLTVRDFKQIIAYQFVVRWNPAHLEFLDAENPYNYNTNWAEARSGVLRLVWTDMTLKGLDLPDNAALALFAFKVAAKDEGFYPVAISADEPTTRFEAANLQTSAIPMIAVVGGVCVECDSLFSNAPLQFVTLETQIQPCYEGTGYAYIKAAGGARPYTYRWSGPRQFNADTSYISNLYMGNYRVVVSDSVGNQISADFYFPTRAFNTLRIEVKSLKPAYCNSPTGGVELAVSEGVPPYLIKWSDNSPSTVVRNGLKPGSYTVTATDATKCALSTYDIHIPDNFGLSIRADSTNADCRFQTLGKARVKSVTGTGPWQYRWSTGATEAQITSLQADFYTVTVTDALGCTGVGTTYVRDYGTFDWTIYGYRNCATWNAVSGFIILTAHNNMTQRAKFPLTVQWSTGNVDHVTRMRDTVSYLSNLQNGNYQITVSDAEGCRQILRYGLECNSMAVEHPQSVQDNAFLFFENDPDETGCAKLKIEGASRVQSMEFEIRASNVPIKSIKSYNISWGIKDTNFSFQQGIRKFSWKSRWPWGDLPRATLFKVCLERGDGFYDKATLFFGDQVLPKIVYTDSMERGFVGRGDYVDLKYASSSWSPIFFATVLPRSCRTENKHQIILNQSFKYLIPTNLRTLYNGGTIHYDWGNLFDAKPGFHSIWHQDYYDAKLLAYIPNTPIDSAGCTWPGDADNNGAVNHHDLLYWALALNTKGPKRAKPDSLYWYGYHSPDWPWAAPHVLVNPKHSDGNGEGVVDFTDTLAIAEHWGQVRDPYHYTPYDLSYQVSETQPEAPILSIKTVPSVQYPCGKRIRLPINLKVDQNQWPSGLHGVAFSVDYPQLDSPSIRFEPLRTWGDHSTTPWAAMQRNFPEHHRLDVAFTRLDGKPSYGDGPIGYIHWETPQCPTDSLRTALLFLGNAVGIDTQQHQTKLKVEVTKVPLRGLVGVDKVDKAKISVFLRPNPATNHLQIHSPAAVLQRLEIMDWRGVLIMAQNLSGNQAQCSVTALPPGGYVARVYTEAGVAVRKVVVNR